MSIQTYPNTFPAREDYTLDTTSIHDAAIPLVLDPNTASGGGMEMEEPSGDAEDSGDGEHILIEEATIKFPQHTKSPATIPTQDVTSRKVDSNFGIEEHFERHTKLPTIAEHGDEEEGVVEVEDPEPLLASPHVPTPPRSLRQRRERHETP